jgi:hypothetical protein
MYILNPVIHISRLLMQILEMRQIEVQVQVANGKDRPRPLIPIHEPRGTKVELSRLFSFSGRLR